MKVNLRRVEVKRKVKFDIGETVWIKTCIDQFPRQITGYIIRLHSVVYCVSQAGAETVAYDYELTDINPLFQNNNQ